MSQIKYWLTCSACERQEPQLGKTENWAMANAKKRGWRHPISGVWLCPECWRVGLASDPRKQEKGPVARCVPTLD